MAYAYFWRWWLADLRTALQARECEHLGLRIPEQDFSRNESNGQGMARHGMISLLNSINTLNFAHPIASRAPKIW